MVFDVDRNELFSSVPTRQSFGEYPHFLGNFAVHKSHETTVRCQCRNLYKKFLPHCTKRFEYTGESSVQRSAQAIFIVALTLPSSIKSALTTGCSIKSSVSCSTWTKVEWTCVHCNSCKVAGYLWSFFCVVGFPFSLCSLHRRCLYPKNCRMEKGGGERSRAQKPSLTFSTLGPL